MDNKTIFVKTSKGESEMHGKTSHLSDSLRRALLMVDGSSTFSEISKRSAPSMRASLGETFEELERTGFIQDKDKVGKIPKIAAPQKMSVPGKMSVPNKMPVPNKSATTNKKQPVDEEAGELDFLTGFPVTPPEKPVIVPDNSKSLMAQAEERSRQKIEAEKIEAEKTRAQREAEAIRHKAEQDAARIREEAMRRAKEEAEARKMREEPKASKSNTGKDPGRLLEDAIRGQQQDAETKRMLPEQHAGKGREGQEPSKSNAGQDPDQQHLEAAIKEQQLVAEAARALADREKKERDELEAARLKIEEEAKQRLEAAAREREKAEAARIKAEQEAAQILLEMEQAKKKAEEEAKARLEAEVKARIEAEIKARLEAEAKARARIKAEEEARAREAAELLARQERDDAAREAAARAAEAREAAVRATKTIEDSPASGSEGFAFDQFQIEEPQNLAGKEYPPAQKGSSRDDFALDSFHVDEPRPAEPPKSRQGGSVQRTETTRDTDAESASARDKHDKERKDREKRERIAAEARARDIVEAEAKAKEEADAQTREIADAQARVWAEAEQRALENAKVNAERVDRQVEYSTPEISHVEKPVRVARVRREPFAWGKLVGFVFKLGLFLLVLLVAALFIIPYTLPMRDYMPKVQQLLSARLHQPVHLGNLSGRILPMPRLDLGEIYIGDAKQFQAVDAQINFDVMGLFADIKPISSVDFHDVKVRGPWVRDVAGWLQQLASQDQYPVSRITISQGTFDADVFQLTGVEGELDFNPAGKFTKANLQADAGKFSMDLVAAPANKLQAAITVRNSALPMLPNWPFDELVAKGELSNDELLIKSFDAKILGGIVQGDAVINWRSGWRAQGALSAKAIVMKEISKLLDGMADGTAHFKMTSSDLAGLAGSVLVDGSFKSNDGMLSGMDIVETARLHSKENIPGGRTHYDALSGNISYSNDAYHFSQVKIDAGVMDATAAFDATKQQLSGKMDVKLSLRDLSAPVTLQMGGAPDSPTLLFAR